VLFLAPDHINFLMLVWRSQLVAGRIAPAVDAQPINSIFIYFYVQQIYKGFGRAFINFPLWSK
jgi:hypothetical protein